MSPGLRQRLITGLLLAGCFLLLLFWAPQSLWLAVVVLAVAVAAHEWAGLVRLSQRGRLIYALLLSLVVLSSQLPLPIAGLAAVLYLVAALFWLLLAPWWLWRRPDWPSAVGLVVGVIVLLPTFLALIELRAVSPALLLAAFGGAWVADIAAYFTGRRFGQRRLAAAISPGKTWEGAWGATLAVMVYLALLKGLTSLSWPWGLCLIAALLFTALAIVGDLFESCLKRQAGLKDSGRCLPGHGGLLDRIDSQTSTLPLVAACVQLGWL